VGKGMGVVTSTSIADAELVSSFSCSCTSELSSDGSVEKVVISSSSNELWVVFIKDRFSVVLGVVVIDWMIVDSVIKDVCCSDGIPVVDVDVSSSNRLVIISVWDVDSILTGLVLSLTISELMVVEDWVAENIGDTDSIFSSVINSPLDEVSVGRIVCSS
jgi:hypothetical protein